MLRAQGLKSLIGIGTVGSWGTMEVRVREAGLHLEDQWSRYVAGLPPFVFRNRSVRGPRPSIPFDRDGEHQSTPVGSARCSVTSVGNDRAPLKVRVIAVRILATHVARDAPRM